MPSLDTNCLLRWLLDDIPEQAALVNTLIDSGECITVADAAIIETIFVLEKLKKISRNTIAKAVTVVICTKNIQCSRELFMEVLPAYTSHPKLSFVDCYLEVLARRNMTAPLLTFDQKLANQLSGVQLLSS